MPLRICWLLAIAASVDTSHGAGALRLSHLRERTSEAALSACEDPDFCYMLTDRGISMEIAKTCFAVESGEIYCGGQPTCVAKIFTPEADTCHSDRLVCCSAANCLKTQVAEQVADALKNKEGNYLNPACPTKSILQTNNGMYMSSLQNSKKDVLKSDIVCTEFNPSEGSRSYVDGSSVEPAENNHIKSRLSSLSSQAWTPEVFTLGGYIEITINRPLSMRGIVTQGGSGKWVTEYEVWTSADGREDNYDPQGFFQGNVDDETKVSNVLPLPVSANFVRLYPQKWVGGVALRVGLVLCHQGGERCVGGKAMTKNPSTADRNYTTRWLRASRTAYGGDAQLDGPGWCAGWSSKDNWAEIDLHTVEKVQGLVFQGVKTPHHADDSMVTKFKFAYSYDGETWMSVDKLYTTGVSLEEPMKQVSMSTSALFAARKIRVYPQEWIGKTPCMRFGARVCADPGDGCVGNHWCEMLMSAGGNTWTAKDALMCKINGDLWFCATTSDTVGIEYTSTCVGYAPDAKSDEPCFSNRMYCAGDAPENQTGLDADDAANERTFGSLYVQAQQVIRARKNIAALGISVTHPECPQENRKEHITGASNWKWATQTSCGQSDECPAENELKEDPVKKVNFPIEVESLNDVSKCRHACEEYNVCEGFAVRMEGQSDGSSKAMCRLYRQTSCGRQQDPDADCWHIESLSAAQGTLMLTENPANFDKMADSSVNAGSWGGRKAMRESAPHPPAVPNTTHHAHLLTNGAAAPTPFPTPDGSPVPTPLPTEEPTPAPTLTKATAAPGYDFPAGYGKPHWSNSLKDYVYEVMGDPMTPLRKYVKNLEALREGRANDQQMDERGQEIQFAGTKNVWKNRSDTMKQAMSDSIQRSKGAMWQNIQTNKHSFRAHALKIRDRQMKWRRKRQELKSWQRQAVMNTTRAVSESDAKARKFMMMTTSNHSKWKMLNNMKFQKMKQNWTTSHKREVGVIQATRGMERMNRTKGTMNYRVSTMVRDAMDTVPTDQEAYEAELAAQGIPVVKSTGPSLEATGTFSGTFSDFQGDRARVMQRSREQASQVDAQARAQQAQRIEAETRADQAQAAAASKALEEGRVLPQPTEEPRKIGSMEDEAADEAAEAEASSTTTTTTTEPTP